MISAEIYAKAKQLRQRITQAICSENEAGYEDAERAIAEFASEVQQKALEDAVWREALSDSMFKTVFASLGAFCQRYGDREKLLEEERARRKRAEADRDATVALVGKALDRLRWNLGGEDDDKYKQWVIGDLRREKIRDEVERPLVGALARLAARGA